MQACRMALCFGTGLCANMRSKKDTALSFRVRQCPDAVYNFVGVLLIDVFLQCRSDSAWAGNFLTEVINDLVGKSDFVKINAEDLLVRKKRKQCLLCVFSRRNFAKLEVFDELLCILKKRIRRRLECLAFIVYRHQIPQPAGVNQRNHLQVLRISFRISDVGLDRLAIADGKLLRGIGCDSLRGIRHERIRYADLKNRVDEFLRIQNARLKSL